MEESYFATRFVALVRSRVTWLVVLFVGELLTATVMDSYEADIAAVMDLVIFIPLIISSGGNSGSQSSSLIIRALALGELSPRDWPRVFVRELGMGIALGSMLGLVGFARVVLSGASAARFAMASTVACSVVAVVTLGTLVGSLMPLLFKRVGLDPAVSSTPFVASLVDVVGLVFYFTIARLIFSLAL
jgi:magnesium transporter